MILFYVCLCMVISLHEKSDEFDGFRAEDVDV